MPNPDHKDLRSAFGTFATGVTIVTCIDHQGPLGFTANSFSSISLDPPLLLWAIAKSSLRHDAFCTAGQFAIHVLAYEDQDQAMSFAKDGRSFDPQKWDLSPNTPPRLKSARSTFICERHAVYEGGDHSMILGKVIDCKTIEGKSLVFCAGQYASF